MNNVLRLYLHSNSRVIIVALEILDLFTNEYKI